MQAQTRTLLKLLALEDTDLLIDALEDGPKEEAAIAEYLGVSQQTANRRLHDLEGWGIVGIETRVQKMGKRGPRPRSWSLRSEDARRFRNTADAFALRLIEQRAEEMRASLDRRRRGELRDAGRAGSKRRPSAQGG